MWLLSLLREYLRESMPTQREVTFALVTLLASLVTRGEPGDLFPELVATIADTLVEVE